MKTRVRIEGVRWRSVIAAPKSPPLECRRISPNKAARVISQAPFFLDNSSFCAVFTTWCVSDDWTDYHRIAFLLSIAKDKWLLHRTCNQ